MRDTEHLPDKVKEAEALFEENRIDILVNSAGVVVKHDFWGIDEKEYDGIMDTNAKGTFFMSQAVGKAMIEKQVKGHILNVTSGMDTVSNVKMGRPWVDAGACGYIVAVWNCCKCYCTRTYCYPYVRKDRGEQYFGT